MAKTEFKFTRFNEYISNGLIHCKVLFTPAVTINCSPAFKKNIKDSCWISFRKGKPPKSKMELESAIGMSIINWC